MVQIIPSILATSEEQYKQDLQKLSSCEALKDGWVHIDFMDNKFVPNKSIDPAVVAKYPTNLHREAHPMASHPLEWIDDLAEVGFERIIFHIEAADNTDECIIKIRKKGLEVGLAINNETLIEKLEPYVDKIDAVLIMTIVPGFQGQPFIPQALEKVRAIKAKNWPVRVGVDGHVRDTNAKAIIESGVDFMIVGSYLLKGNVDENLEKLWEEING